MSSEVLRFEDFELDRGAYQLRRAGRVVHLERIPLDLLFLLAERRDQLVTREEIVKRIWGEGIFLDSSNSINAAVRKIRRALGDEPDTPRFIATVPVKGYRFIATVHEGTAGGIRIRPTRMSFAGRERELAQLREGLANAATGLGSVFLISGEPGIGKTRLTEELTALAGANRMAVMAGHCSDQDRAVPFLPFVEFLENCIDQCSSVDEIRATIGSEGPELARLMPNLRRLLPDLTSPLELPAEQARRHLFNSFCAFVARFARLQPALMILEDLHWADESTLSLLEHLSLRVTALPLLVLITYRDLESDVGDALAKTLENLLRSGLGSRLRLKRLSSDVVALMLNSLSGQTTPPGVVNEIYAETGGNPFFVDELFRHLEEENRLYDREGRFLPQLGIVEKEVPQSVRLVVRRRLARLNESVQKMLGTAAVIGRFFTVPVLAGVETEKLPEKLDDAAEAGLISAQPAGQRFEFSHELIRQAVINGIQPDRRRELHLQIAAAMERIYADALDEHSAELAHHYRGAGETANAIKFLERAAKQASMRSAHEEAVNNIEAALDLLQTLPATDERDHRELDLQIALGAVLTVSKGWSAKEKGPSLLRARDLCLRLGDLVRIVPVLGELIGFYGQRGQFRTGLEMAEDSLPSLLTAAEERNDFPLLSFIHGVLGESSFWTGHFASAWAHFEEVLAHGGLPKGWGNAPWALDLGPDRLVGVQWLTLPVLALAYRGYLDQSGKRLSEILARARVRANTYGLALGMTHCAWGQLLARRPRAAQLLAEEAITLSREHGFEERGAIATCIRGIALSDLGILEEGIDEIRLGLANLSAAHSAVFNSWFRSALALAYGRASKPKQAADALSDALAAVEWAGETFDQAEVLRIKGELCLANGSGPISQAEQSFRDSIELARRQDARLLELRATTSLARLLARTDRSGEAFTMLADIYSWFTEGFDTSDLKEAKLLLDELE